MSDRYDFGPSPVILGQSPSATVYKVNDTQLRRPVALKVFAREDALDDGELATMAGVRNISGANLVSVTDHGRLKVPGDMRQLPFVALDYFEGKSLADDALSRVSWEGASAEDARTWCADALEVVHQCFAGLQQLHQAGLRHHGIKPSNILVMRDAANRVTAAKLMDIGLGSMGRGADQRARALYRAPEQFAGEEVTDAADVFSLGVVAYELLTHRHPFTSTPGNVDGESLARDIASVIPVSISELNPHVPESVGIVIHKALAKDPSDRPSAEEVVRLLKSASFYANAWLSNSAEVDKAKRLYERGALDAATKKLTVLERQGWAFPQMVELRSRINAELELRSGLLARQAEDIAAVEEALKSGSPRQAWWRLELLRLRQECDPYNQTTHHPDVERLRKAWQSAADTEQKWLTRVRDLIRQGRFAEATAECAQIGHAIRPTRAVLAQELETRAQQHRSVITKTMLALDTSSQQERASLAPAAMADILASPDALTECMQLLEARNELIDELRLQAATRHDAKDTIGELDAVETLLKIAPDDKLAEEQRTLEAAAHQQLTEQRLAIRMDTIQRLAEIGDWDRARTLMRSAGELQDNPRLAELASAPKLAGTPKLADPPKAAAPEPKRQPAQPARPAPLSEPKAPALVSPRAAAVTPLKPPVKPNVEQELLETPPPPQRTPQPARPAPKPYKQPANPRTRSRTIIGVGAAGIVMMMLAAIAIPRDQALVTFSNLPGGATLAVDGHGVSNASLVLAPGTHRWSMEAAGYQPAAGQFKVGRKPMNVPLQLKALAVSEVKKPAAPTQPEKPPQEFGSLLVLTPGQSAVTVLVDNKRVGRTVGQKYTIDSLVVGKHSITVQKEGGFCLSEPLPRKVAVVRDAQGSETFSLQPWPRLTVNSDAPNADVLIAGDKSGAHRAGQEIPLKPGTHRYTVKAAARQDATGEVELECGVNRALTVSQKPAVVAERETPAREGAIATPKTADAGWSENCFKAEIGWEKAARDCFYNADEIRRYSFEVRRIKRGGVGPVGGGGVYGPWLVGTAGAFVECKIEDGEFRWRPAGRGDWQREKVELPKDPASLFVRVSASGEGAHIDISTDARFSNAQRVQVGAAGGFGVKKDTQIREFRRN